MISSWDNSASNETRRLLFDLLQDAVDEQSAHDFGLRGTVKSSAHIEVRRSRWRKIIDSIPVTEGVSDACN
jgi:hypothetical protein